MAKKAPQLFSLLRADLLRQSMLKDPKVENLGVVRALKGCLEPRFHPVLLCRLSRASYLLGIPLLPFVFSYLNLVLFGLQITPKCEIGGGLFLPHPVGTVLGAWRIGQNATIFQQVTLGAKHLDMAFTPDLLPEIFDNVTIGSGAKAFGKVKLGDHVVVGTNSVVTQSFEAYSIVVGIPARKVAS